MNRIIDLGKYIEIGINALEENLSFLWGAIDDGISWTVDRMNDLLLSVPFGVFLLIVVVLAWYAKSGRLMFKKEGLKKGIGLVSFIVIGLGLIYAMG
ncbi:MAG: glycine/betaine ABC transporter, partial [Bacteroidales bacterium]|nr:glycine/betaine ABC transporter [Bacteroidales bacterium]